MWFNSNALPAVQESSMNPSSDGLRYGIRRVRLLATKADLDDALLVFDEQPNGFAPEFPHVGQLADAIVPLKRRLFRLLDGGRPITPFRGVEAERRRIFATLLFFDRTADLARFLWVHGRRKLAFWSGLEARRRARG